VTAHFASTFEELTTGGSATREPITIPFAPDARGTATASWAWLAHVAPEERRPQLYRNDSLTLGTLRTATPSTVPYARQVIRLGAGRDSLFAEITVRDTVVVRWTAWRVR
jgi:hypothetical protein